MSGMRRWLMGRVGERTRAHPIAAVGSLYAQRGPTLVPAFDQRGRALRSWQLACRRGHGLDNGSLRGFASQATTGTSSTEQRKQDGKGRNAPGGKKQGGGGKHGGKRGKGGGGPRITPAERELQSAILKCTGSQEVLATLQQAMDWDESVINHVHVAGALHRVAKLSKRSRGLRLDRDPTFKRYVDGKCVCKHAPTEQTH
jgi:hypothetical protein